MSSPLVYGPYASDDEQRAFEQLASDTFSFRPPERAQEYFASIPRQNMRILRQGGAVVGGLALLDGGQWFGGRAVPMTGIAVVAVAPHVRAQGAGTELMRACVRELHERGVALSALYPATVRFYRRVGYELAGTSCDMARRARDIELRDRTLAVRPFEARDEQAVRAVYREYARTQNGLLDRSEFHWGRTRRWMAMEPAQGYVLEGDGRVQGYAFHLAEYEEPFHQHLRVIDMAAVTPAAMRGLLTHLADYRTIRDEVRWRTGPVEPLLGLLDEGPYAIACKRVWMLRVVEVAAALAGRGYPRAVQAELHLDIRDADLPANHGRWVLSVADGVGRLERGGRGSVRVEITGLAPLYSSYLSPHALARMGLLSGPGEELDAAAAVFAGPPPWMPDGF